MDIREILIRQKKELEELNKKELVKREVNIDINKEIIKVITGIRRCGKSTFGYLLLKDKNFGYINFDERELLDFKSTEIEKGIKEIYGNTKFLFIDEIQNYDKWELWINSLYRRGYNLIITRSNAKLLSKELSTHLTGRYISIELFPFSFREILDYLKFNKENLDFDKEKQGEILKILKDYLEIGGFPEIWVKNLDINFLKTLFNDILLKDIVIRWKVKYIELLEELSYYLINNFSSYYTINKIKNSLDFRSKETVKNYIKYLEEAYLIFSLNNFSFKFKEVLKSPKKIYIIDNGIINAIRHNYMENIGRLMENLVFLSLRRKYKENENIFYFENNNYEIDFLIKEGNKITKLINVTYVNNFDEIDKRETRSLIHGYDLFKEYNPELIIITWDYEDEKEISWFNKKGKIRFIPLYRWLLNI
ncbi:ATPase AAA [Nanoarchaeota archaeon]